MSDISECEENLTSPDILDAAKEITHNLLPAKSRKLYDKCYHDFMAWKMQKRYLVGSIPMYECR